MLIVLLCYIIALKRLVAENGRENGNRYRSIERDDFCAIGIVAKMSNGDSSNGGGGEEGGSEGGDNVTGSSEAPTEGIILIVFVLLMMCL